MANEKKFLDSSGIGHLWDRIEERYPNMDELGLIIDAIDEAKADRTDIVQADWNQNDETALDYVKNRTHWVDGEYEILLEEYGVTKPPGHGNQIPEFHLSTPFYTQIGEEYDVQINGVMYHCVVQPGYIEGTNTLYNEYLPAYFTCEKNGRVRFRSEEEFVDIIIGHLNGQVHKIDKKFLPEHLNFGPMGYSNIELYNKSNIQLYTEQNWPMAYYEEPTHFSFKENAKYTVILNGKEYNNLSTFIWNNDYISIGAPTPDDVATSEIPFFITTYTHWDEEGKSTEFLYVALPSSETFLSNIIIKEDTVPSVVRKINHEYLPTPDWSINNENQGGYIKNRTHWAENKNLVLTDRDIRIYKGSSQALLGTLWETVEPNKEYEVIFNDILYNCTSWISESGGESFILLGSGYIIDGEKDIATGMVGGNEEPFCCEFDLNNSKMYLHMPTQEAETWYSIKIIDQGEVHRLDKKYLPKGLATEEYVATELANLIGTAPETLDTIEELATAFQENEDIIETLNQAIINKADKTDLENYYNKTEIDSYEFIAVEDIDEICNAVTEGSLESTDVDYLMAQLNFGVSADELSPEEIEKLMNKLSQ